MRSRLDGITPILAMPFTSDGDVVVEGLHRQVDFLDGAGVRAVGFGFGSEITRLTEREALAALTSVSQHASERIEVMATVGGGSERAVESLAADATSAGADILMVRPPGGSPEQVAKLIGRVHSATGRPIVVQDAPQMTGIQLSPTAMAAIVAEVEGVCALKIEAPNSSPKIGRLVETVGADVSILGGAGGLDFVNELGRGAHGTVPFVAFAPMFVEVQRLFTAGDALKARDLFATFVPCLTLALRSLDTALWTFKELLRRKGVLTEAYLRQPCETMGDDFVAELDEALADIERWGSAW
jgi:dihydrodipicolinate synthase/N-acetylneuraminate lyase